MKKTYIFKRLVVGGMISLTLVLSTAQCFGKFPLVKTVYKVNQSILAGDNSKTAKVIRSIAMLVGMIVYGPSTILDILVFNLYEFWTGKDLLTASNGSNSPVKLTLINENEMRVDVKGGKISSFHVFRDRPGEFFIKEGDRYLPIVLPEDLTAFDDSGATTFACVKTQEAVRCFEGADSQAFVQSEIRQADYERLQYRTRLAFGIGAETASR